jgi:glycosyltransferase involved in cell wall biosynthesis
MAPEKYNFGVSVLIPAYNHREFLHNAILSVTNQKFRPIQIIIADDCSSEQLLTEQELFDLGSMKDIKINYFKNDKNLGFYKNYRNALSKVTNKYFILLPSDDHFTDFNFFAKAVNQLDEKNSEIYCYVANSFDERSNDIMMNKLEFKEKTLTSEAFISNVFKKFHTNHAAIMLNFEKLNALDYQNKLLSDNEITFFKLIPDEGFICLFVMSLESSFRVNSDSVVVRGYNKNSWSRSAYWVTNKNACMFVTYYKLLKATPKISKAARVTLYTGMVRIWPIMNFNFDLFIKLSGTKFKTLYLLSVLYGILRRYKWKIDVFIWGKPKKWQTW